MKRIPRGAFFAACCEEPFRIFFPLGLLVGLMGVSLWPLYFSGIHKFYPGVMHARLMVEGFMSAFVLGFLGTSGPRLTDTPHFSRGELRALLALYVATVALQIGEQNRLGDICFLLLLVTFASRMGWRFAHTQDLPPPGFVLVAFGLFAAISGTTLALIGASGQPFCSALGGPLVNQAFVLFLVLGVGSFLLPRFLNLVPKPSVQWRRRAMFASLAGTVIFGAFVAEAAGLPARIAALARFLAAGAYLLSEIPLHHAAIPRVTLAQSVRLAIVLLALGLLCQAIWPVQRVAALHVVFIGGFSLITFTVATRVILGHSGNQSLFIARLSFVIGMLLLLVPAMGLRFVGDFLPHQRSRLLTWSAILWMCGALVWAWRVIPKVRFVESE